MDTRHSTGGPSESAVVDEEVSPRVCADVLGKASNAGPGRVEVAGYDGATHDFDDPGKSRQSVAANRAANDDAMRRASAPLDALP